jgi:hypothetical protein
VWLQAARSPLRRRPRAALVVLWCCSRVRWASRRVKEHKEQVVEKRRAIEALENGTVVRPWLSCAACWRAGPYLSVSVMSGVEL